MVTLNAPLRSILWLARGQEMGANLFEVVEDAKNGVFGPGGGCGNNSKKGSDRKEIIRK